MENQPAPPMPTQTRSEWVRAQQVQRESNPQLLCPHCQTRGHVRTTRVRVKKGISGGKATGAVLTAGLSLMATGLSRKSTVTKATCDNCHMSWTIA